MSFNFFNCECAPRIENNTTFTLFRDSGDFASWYANPESVEPVLEDADIGLREDWPRGQFLSGTSNIGWTHVADTDVSLDVRDAIVRTTNTAILLFGDGDSLYTADGWLYVVVWVEFWLGDEPFRRAYLLRDAWYDPEGIGEGEGGLDEPMGDEFAADPEDVPASIPDNNPSGVDVPVVVSGIATDAELIGIHIEVSHGWVGDLEITVTNPATTSVEIFGYPFHAACSQTALDVFFVPGSGTPYACAGPSGVFHGDNNVSGLNGSNPNGTWNVNVADKASPDGGTVDNVTLIFEA